MALLVPVTRPEMVLEAMKKDLMCGGVIPEGQFQKKDRDALLVTESFQPTIGVEQVFNPNPPGKGRSIDGIRMNLGASLKPAPPILSGCTLLSWQDRN